MHDLPLRLANKGFVHSAMHTFTRRRQMRWTTTKNTIVTIDMYVVVPKLNMSICKNEKKKHMCFLLKLHKICGLKAMIEKNQRQKGRGRIDMTLLVEICNAI